MDKKISDKINSWINDAHLAVGFRDQIKVLVEKNDEKELVDAFYKDLEFGTGGVRGVMGVGSNRLNVYTIRKVTQGLADYIKEASGDLETPKVAIAYDSRNNSILFSRETAAVLAANKIKAYLFPRLTPVGPLSFAVRELGAVAGINITASHNPPKYNGYKVYWSDGCQVTPPHDKGIIKKFNDIADFSQVKWTDFDSDLAKEYIETIPESLEQKYFQQTETLSLGKKEYNQGYKLIYTPLHGSGAVPVKEILRLRGFQQLKIVKSQEEPDGNFPTVSSPNPEDPKALDIAMKGAEPDDQLILATDPDADRLGVMVKHKNSWVKLNGNQIGQLLLEYYLRKLKEKDSLPKDGVYITTIVTSELGEKIAAAYGVRTEQTLTGFKYIGSIMRELEKDKSGTYIFGMEESHGYLFGDFARDKDAVGASMIFAEACAEMRREGLDPVEQLEKIHRKYGFHQDYLLNKVIEGQAGAQKISQIMDSLRDNRPTEIAGVKLEKSVDYKTGDIVDCLTGKIIGKSDLPESNVLAFFMEDKSRITIRPSGTEPKIKVYFNLTGDSPEALETSHKLYREYFEKVLS